MKIPFNKPYYSGKESLFIQEAIEHGKISGDGLFTRKCHDYFVHRYNFQNPLLTTSCTDALEMAAVLIDIKDGDEVIMPSYTFVSTANAFVLRGAKVVFCDSRDDHPGLDEAKIEQLISPKTKAIVPVHYAGVSCDMKLITSIASKHSLFVIEDAAQAIDNFYINDDGTKRALGTFGDLSAFSFHETKNVISGEGGMLVINNPMFLERAEIIREKGTNRSKFFRGEIDKYGWVDIGSSFLPSDIIAAFLYAQLESIEDIQEKRKSIWDAYYSGLLDLSNNGFIKLPTIPSHATNNYHMFYVLCRSLSERTTLMTFLRKHDVMSVFHYQSLHKSEFYLKSNPLQNLPFSDYYSDHLLRLPFYNELSIKSVEHICNLISQFFGEQH